MTPDLKARKIVVASILYYSFNESMMADEKFDKLCVEVVEEWDQLPPLRQWQLGSAEEIKASGFHIKATTLAVDSSISWLASHRANPRIGKRVFSHYTWQWDKQHHVHWLPAGGMFIKETK